ncbi:DNA primase [Streptomyces sp. SID6139]|uniref:DNA primase n=1 Tax=Streptomyces sp. SID6139 TaxID=2690320 RepID=UPI00136EFDF7|nr:DNA primase [Streptomyces sp. SID6139]
MNRTALGLAIGAGYFLGRTRKLKMAIAVGSLVAGKKLNLGPGALADLARQQLRDNPQFKEIGDQLRTDLRGVGKAASGAMVERQMSTLADRLHDRTAQVRGELPGAPADESDDESDDGPEAEAGRDDEAGRADEDRAADRDDEPDGGGRSTGKPRAQKPAARKTAARRTGTAERTGPAKKRTTGKKTGAQRQTAAKKPAGSRGGGSAKGGDER